jgi:hypothetical protein
MATLQRLIADKFLAKLAESKDVGVDKVELLRELLADGKRPKADDLVRVFSDPDSGELK